MLHDDITELIGNTPLLRLDPEVHRLPGVDLYAKLESHNPFGSVKDRVAWGLLGPEMDRLVAEGRSIVEASSGNTAKAMRMLASSRGVPVTAYTNRAKVPEVRDLLQLLGVDLHELPGLSECPDPTAANDVFTTIAGLVDAEPDRWLHPSQYTNERNVDAHVEGTGREIHDDLGEPVDYVIGGLGTTGSTRGVATFLRRYNPALRLIGVVSTRSDFIPGIRSEAELWDVGLFDPESYEEIVAVDPRRAIDMALRLATRHGVLAGPTSGASYAAALEVLARRPPGQDRVAAVLIVCDRLEPYLSYIRARRPELFGRAKRNVVATVTDAELTATPEVTGAQLAESGHHAAGDPVVVDTRSNMAYRVGHVPRSLNIRDDLLEEMLAHGSPFPPQSRVVFVCPVGERSRRLAAVTRRLGIDARSLAGGIVAWRDDGRPLESSATAPE